MYELLMSFFINGFGKGYFIDGKSIYKPIRKVLNLLFCLSITAFVYKAIYGPYELYDLTEYKQIINFIINGEFFIPFALFVFVYYITAMLSFFINMYLSKSILPKCKKRVSNLIKKVVLKKWNTNQKELIVIKTSFVNLNILNKEKMDGVIKVNNILKANFLTTLRGLIAMIIYFICIKYFGWLLFSFSLFLIIIYVLVLGGIALFIALIPTIDETLTNYMQELSENETIEQE